MATQTVGFDPETVVLHTDPNVLGGWLSDLLQKAQGNLLAAEVLKTGKDWWICSPLGDLALRTERGSKHVTYARLLTPTFVTEVPNDIHLHLERDIPNFRVNAIMEWRDGEETHSQNISSPSKKHPTRTADGTPLIDFVTMVSEITA